MRDRPKVPVSGALGAALALALLLSQGFDWPERAERLVNALTSATTPRDRRDALRLLSELAARTELPPTLDLHAVEAASHNVDPDVRADAWALWARLHPEPEAVLPALRDTSPAVRLVAIRELARRAPGHEGLVRAVTDPDPAVRSAALHALSTATDPRALPLLAEALRDLSLEVRVEAVRALAARPEPQARELVEDRADDPLPELRVAALDALVSLVTDSAQSIREAAPGALALCQRALDDGDQAVVLAGLRCLERAHQAGRSPSERVETTTDDPRVAALARSLVPVVSSAARRLLQREHASAVDGEGPLAGAGASGAPVYESAWLAPLESTASASLSVTEAELRVHTLEEVLPAGETLAADPLLEWLPRVPLALRARVAALIARTGARLAERPTLALLSVPTASSLRAAYGRLLAQTSGPETDARLLRLLDDRDAHVREAAVYAATRSLRPESLTSLGERLGDATGTRRHEVLAVLGALLDRTPVEFRAPSSRALVRALTSDLAQHDEVSAALALRVLGGLDDERARVAVRATLDDARPDRVVAALRASTRDRSDAARSARRRLLEHREPRVAATAMIALSLADDVLPVLIAERWLHDTAWPLGPAASFALARAQLKNDRSVALFDACAWLTSDEPITRHNMRVAIASRHTHASDSQHDAAPSCGIDTALSAPSWTFEPGIPPYRPGEPAALRLEDSSVIVSLPDASGLVRWSGLTTVSEVSAFLPEDKGL